ncbi:unnamed protein product [Mytilus edulis]|uniref:Uncharacterized protein n=1 Tax=Mytilus edulis TaxID=6550 RepID=A0A8S3RAU7_MYTED|nr:unnamed protein product [Mytilus edulis]
MLKATSQARSEDFRALYNLTILNNKDIALAKQQLTDIYNGSTIDTKIKRLNDNMTHLNTTVLGLTTRGSISNNLNAIVSEHSQRVGFTTCGGSILSGGRLNFPLVKSSHGIYVPSYYRDGKFSPSKAGFYRTVTRLPYCKFPPDPSTVITSFNAALMNTDVEPVNFPSLSLE